ncbi:MAG: ATP-binding protein [Cyclobacteriaceae bacterium]
MTTETKKQIAEAVRQAIASGTSQAALEGKSGVNNRYIQAIRDGLDYVEQKDRNDKVQKTAIKDEYYIKLADVLGIFQKQFHFNTKNYQRIVQMCDYAKSTLRSVLIDSRESGAGKTHSLTKYAKAHRKEVIYIKHTSLMKGRDLIEDILDQMNITIEGRMSNTRKLRLITNKVLTKQIRLIIIDELDKGTVAFDTWKVIKDIRDALDHKCSVTISGKGLISELKGGSDAGKKLMPQLWRRFSTNKLLLTYFNAPKQNNVETACNESGITDPAVHNLLAKFCYDFQMLREYIEDIHRLVIDKGLEANYQNVGTALGLINNQNNIE